MNCDNCNKSTKDTSFETENGEYICQDCYESRVDRAEYLYDNYMEAQITGN